MTLSEIALLVGAGAWIPQIVKFIYWLRARPKISVFAGKRIDISSGGAVGTLLSVFWALYTERKDVTVKNINAEIVHEDGQKICLEWVHIYEEQAKISWSIGHLTQNITKEQAAIILRLTTASAVQANIAFSDLEFELKFQDYMKLLISEKDRLIKTGESDIKKSMFSSKIYNDFCNFYENQQFWKAGNYTLKFSLQTDKLSRPNVEEFQFLLHQGDIDKLSKNKKVLMQFILPTLFPEEQNKDTAQEPLLEFATAALYPKRRTG